MTKYIKINKEDFLKEYKKVGRGNLSSRKENFDPLNYRSRSRVYIPQWFPYPYNAYMALQDDKYPKAKMFQPKPRTQEWWKKNPGIREIIHIKNRLNNEISLTLGDEKSTILCGADVETIFIYGMIVPDVNAGDYMSEHWVRCEDCWNIWIKECEKFWEEQDGE